MTAHDIKSWWKAHEAWVAVFIVCIAMYLAGLFSAVTTMRSDYRQEVDRLSTSYEDSLRAKDALIENLAKTNAQTAGNAATAAAAAASASNVANKAAGTASQIVESDKKALEKMK